VVLVFHTLLPTAPPKENGEGTRKAQIFNFIPNAKIVKEPIVLLFFRAAKSETI